MILGYLNRQLRYQYYIFDIYIDLETSNVGLYLQYVVHWDENGWGPRASPCRVLFKILK